MGQLGDEGVLGDKLLSGLEELLFKLASETIRGTVLLQGQMGASEQPLLPAGC